MAIDTVSKRRSILGLFNPFTRPLPIPDGTINAGDRAHLALMYSGIDLAGLGATIVGSWANAIEIVSVNQRIEIVSANKRINV